MHLYRQRPRNVPSLYESQPIKCKQCAFRFPQGRFGKKRMEEHLDMHFRQNKRNREISGRGHSRNWFLSVQVRNIVGISTLPLMFFKDWVSEPLIDIKGKGRESSGTKTSDVSLSGEAGKRDATLRASIVVVPPGDEAKTISCPVCKEVLKSEFQEDEEEWVWRNAVQIKDKVT